MKKVFLRGRILGVLLYFFTVFAMPYIIFQLGMHWATFGLMTTMFLSSLYSFYLFIED